MNNEIIEFLKEKNIDEVLKKIRVAEFVEYVNKYIGEGLEVGKKYEYNGRDSIHYIIIENIKKGLHELYSKYGIDYAKMFDFLRVNTWQLSISIDYKEVSVWENIGKYDFETKTRKNASSSNSTFILESIPKFEMYDSWLRDKLVIRDYVSYDIKSLNIYEFYIGLLEGQRQRMIGRYESEILGWKRNIADNKKMISNLEDLLF